MDRVTDSSRRNFLKSATVLTATAAGLANQSVMAGIGGGKPRADKLKLGVKPEAAASGPAVIEVGDTLFVAFYGAKEGKRGQDLGDGTAFLAIRGCQDWRLRKPEDEEFPAHSVDVESLDFCEIYEVANSDWQSPASVVGSPTQAVLKHYILTFFGFQPGVTSGGVHFECLATGLDVDFFTHTDFGSMMESMVLKELSSEPATQPRSTGRTAF